MSYPVRRSAEHLGGPANVLWIILNGMGLTEAAVFVARRRLESPQAQRHRLENYLFYFLLHVTAWKLFVKLMKKKMQAHHLLIIRVSCVFVPPNKLL